MGALFRSSNIVACKRDVSNRYERASTLTDRFEEPLQAASKKGKPGASQ